MATKKDRNGVQGCLSDIADNLERIADAMEKQAGITKTPEDGAEATTVKGKK